MEPTDLIESGVYIGSTFLFPKRSIRLILDNLQAGEQVLAMATCNTRLENELKAGAVAVTNHRVIFGSTVLNTNVLVEIDSRQVTEVNSRSNANSDLTIKSSTQTLSLSALTETTAQTLANKIEIVRKNRDNPSKSWLAELEKNKPVKKAEEENGTIKRSIIWKIVNLSYIPVFHLLFFTSPLALLYAGITGKKKTWVTISLLSSGASILAYLLFHGSREDIFFLLLACNWIFTLIYSISTAGEFLKRLDTPTSWFTTAVKKNAIHHQPNLQLADRFIEDLSKWKREIEPVPIKENIQKIIDISTIIKNRGSVDSERFFVRYGDTVNKLLNKYDEMENTRLNTKEIKEAMNNLEGTLDQTVIAFENELAAMYKYDVLDMNAETAVFLQDLRNRGLLENDN